MATIKTPKYIGRTPDQTIWETKELKQDKKANVVYIVMDDLPEDFVFQMELIRECYTAILQLRPISSEKTKNKAVLFWLWAEDLAPFALNAKEELDKFFMLD